MRRCEVVGIDVFSNKTEYSPAWVVDDFLYETTDVTIAFCKVECAETGGCFVVMGMGFELGKSGGCWVDVVSGRERENARWHATAVVP